MPAVNEHEVADRTVRMDLAYRGTGFRGFAANEGVRTVAGELGAALERILGSAPALTVAGRTDAGVHATGQVVSFRIGAEGQRRVGGDEPGAHLDRLAASLNHMLHPEIAVTAAAIADDGFDARHSATARAYEYRVCNVADLDPRYADLEWHVPAELDIDRMNAAARHFVGEHDFTSFCRRPKDRPGASLMRTVLRAHWRAPTAENHLLFEIEANAFCHQMVRAIVGQCVAVGRGDRAPDGVPAVLQARRRDTAAPIAPAHGLTLVGVRYAAERNELD